MVGALGSLSAVSSYLCLGALAVLTVLAYARIWSLGWVYDDTHWLPLSFDACRCWSFAPRLSGHPIVYWGDWPHWSLAPFQVANWIGGGLPWAYHGLILLLHLLNGLVVWRISSRWCSTTGAWLAVLLFWLHPIQTQAVAYVSGGVDVLLTTYLLVALIALNSPRWPRVLLACGCLWLAVTLKLSALPAVLLVPLIAQPRLRWLAIPCGICAWWWAASTNHLPTMHVDTSVPVAVVSLLGSVVWPFGYSVEHDWWAASSSMRWIASMTLLTWLASGLRWRGAGITALVVLALVLPRAFVPDAPPLLEHHTYPSFLPIWLWAGSLVSPHERTI